MTDLEMTKLCAEAMGLHGVQSQRRATYSNVMTFTTETIDRSDCITYNNAARGEFDIYAPLTDDAQAMALLKTFHIDVTPYLTVRGLWWWQTGTAAMERGIWPVHAAESLNRAIVECVARLQSDGRAQEAVTVARRSKQDGAVEPTTQVLEAE